MIIFDVAEAEPFFGCNSRKVSVSNNLPPVVFCAFILFVTYSEVFKQLSLPRVAVNVLFNVGYDLAIVFIGICFRGLRGSDLFFFLMLIFYPIFSSLFDSFRQHLCEIALAVADRQDQLLKRNRHAQFVKHIDIFIRNIYHNEIRDLHLLAHAVTDDEIR